MEERRLLIRERLHSVSEKVAKLSVAAMVVVAIVGIDFLAIPSLTLFLASGATEVITSPK